MPVGAGTRSFPRRFKTNWSPAHKFKPGFILISAGFDGMRNDVLGRFEITPDGFRAMTRVVVYLADELRQGRLVSVLGAEYRLDDGLSESVAAPVKDPAETLSGGRR